MVVLAQAVMLIGVMKFGKTLPKKAPQPKEAQGQVSLSLNSVTSSQHVVRKCGSVTVGDNTNKQVSASVRKTNATTLLCFVSHQQKASAEPNHSSKLNVEKLGLKLVPLASEGLVRSDEELGNVLVVESLRRTVQ